MDTEWQAAAWFLERRYSEMYGRTERVVLDRLVAMALVVIAQEVADRGALSRVAQRLVDAFGVEVPPVAALHAGADAAPARRVALIKAEPPADAVR